MKKIFLYKADPITNKEPVEDVEIHIKKNLDDSREWKSMKEINEFYKNEALDLFDAMRKHLPQGTRHQLLILLLKDTENFYAGV